MKKKNKEKIVIIGSCLTVVLAVMGCYKMGLKSIDGKSNGELVSRVNRLKVARNDDENVVGWIKVNGTNIDYPVRIGVLSESNKDIIWTNDTLGDGRNRKVILGHNLLNVSSKPLVNTKNLTRFEPLMAYVYQDFTEEHLYIQYVDIDSEESLYKIYAVSFYETNDDLGESYTNKEDINNYIKTVKSNSIYDFGVDVNYKDDLITLSTCTRFFGVKGPTHFKIDARRVRKNEKIDKYSVKKSCNYDIMNKE